MKRSGPDLEPELEAFLAHHRVDRYLSPEVRARALARTQSIITGGGVLPRGPLRELHLPAPLPAPRRRIVRRVALAGSVALTIAVVGQVVASRGRIPLPRRPSLPETGSTPLLVEGPSLATQSSPALATRPDASRATGMRPRREVPAQDLFALELELLQHAQSAYTLRDYPTALDLLAEHARLFPRGSLAEEREALRVRSLLASGHASEARRAAAAFARRFPNSVLLPRVDDRESALE